MAPRRESQKNWYESRGMVRAKQDCLGSNEPPLRVTDEGDWVGNGNRVTGSLPRGICPICGDELSLNPKTISNTFRLRKHKDPTAPYKKQVLISETSYNLVYKESLSRKMDLDETVDLLIQNMLVPTPESETDIW